MNRIKYIFIILLFLPANIYAENYNSINIVGGNNDVINLNIAKITGDKFSSKNIAHKIKKTIQNQLNATKIFNIDSDILSIFGKISNNNDKFYYADIEINVSKVKYGEYYIDINLYDNIQNKESIANEFTISGKSEINKISALISDNIFKYFTGIDGYQNTKIAYISESESALNRNRKLAIKEFYNDKIDYLDIDNDLILSPRFTKDGKKIIYLAYDNQVPKFFIYDLETENTKLLFKNKNMNFAPRVSKDGNMIAYSSSFEGNSEIMIYNLLTKKHHRLTNHPAIDTSPDFSHDNKTIIFSSDRDGSQKLYLIDIETKQMSKISFSSGNYSTPRWSPDGKYIAFTKTYRGESHIGIIDMNNLEVKILTNSYKDDTPSWAPNSKFIIFTRMNPHKNNYKSNYSSLYITNLNGDLVKKIDSEYDASDADWIKINF